MPRFLCRYRSVNSNNLEALRTNKIYFSKANKYDDPFDTYLYFDIERITKLLENNFISEEAILTLAEAMKQLLHDVPNNIPEETKVLLTTFEGLLKLHDAGISKSFLHYMLGIRTMMQNKTVAACFSENCFNEALWLKYADNHRGFALIYDYENRDNLHCGKKEMCKECPIYKYGSSLLPVYYSNEPYEATNAVYTILIQEMEKQMKITAPDFLKNNVMI